MKQETFFKRQIFHPLVFGSKKGRKVRLYLFNPINLRHFSATLTKVQFFKSVTKTKHNVFKINILTIIWINAFLVLCKILLIYCIFSEQKIERLKLNVKTREIDWEKRLQFSAQDFKPLKPFKNFSPQHTHTHIHTHTNTYTHTYTHTNTHIHNAECPFIFVLRDYCANFTQIKLF